MAQLFKFIISDSNSALDAIKLISDHGTQFAVVVDAEGRLLGVITDGDIRQALLHSVDLRGSVKNIMNSNPKFLEKGYTHSDLIKVLTKYRIKQVPIIDKNRKVVDVYTSIIDNFQSSTRQNPVVIMAGGLGSRLGQLTSNCPKPLLKVGDKPILEIILENFIEQGFVNFYFSVNYMFEQIESYFKDGSDWGISITYIRETRKLGTAGGLSLADFNNSFPIIIMNGDLLTKVNFSQLLDAHETMNSEATMCVRKYEIQVPYGVIQTEGSKIVDIVEKPTHSFFVNAGIYVLNQHLLNYIHKNEYMDMPTLFEKCKNDGKELVVYPIHEYWLDIGRIEDFEKAQLDFLKGFK